MRRPTRLRRHITFANCTSLLALFIAVSTGGAYAKSTLIDGRTIKPNSIPASSLQNNSVTSAKIRNGQVTGADVKAGSLAPTVFNASTQKQLGSVGVGTGGTGSATDGPHVAGQPCKAATTRVAELVGQVGVWEVGTNHGTPGAAMTNLGPGAEAGTYKTYHCVFHKDGVEYRRLMSDDPAVAVNA